MSRFAARFGPESHAQLYKMRREGSMVTPSRRAPEHVISQMTRRAADREVCRRRQSFRLL